MTFKVDLLADLVTSGILGAAIVAGVTAFGWWMRLLFGHLSLKADLDKTPIPMGPSNLVDRFRESIDPAAIELVTNLKSGAEDESLAPYHVSINDLAQKMEEFRGLYQTDNYAEHYSHIISRLPNSAVAVTSIGSLRHYGPTSDVFEKIFDLHWPKLQSIKTISWLHILGLLLVWVVLIPPIFSVQGEIKNVDFLLSGKSIPLTSFAKTLPPPLLKSKVKKETKTRTIPTPEPENPVALSKQLRDALTKNRENLVRAREWVELSLLFLTLIVLLSAYLHNIAVKTPTERKMAEILNGHTFSIECSKDQGAIEPLRPNPQN